MANGVLARQLRLKKLAEQEDQYYQQLESQLEPSDEAPTRPSATRAFLRPAHEPTLLHGELLDEIDASDQRLRSLLKEAGPPHRARIVKMLGRLQNQRLAVEQSAEEAGAEIGATPPPSGPGLLGQLHQSKFGQWFTRPLQPDEVSTKLEAGGLEEIEPKPIPGKQLPTWRERIGKVGEVASFAVPMGVGRLPGGPTLFERFMKPKAPVPVIERPVAAPKMLPAPEEVYGKGFVMRPSPKEPPSIPPAKEPTIPPPAEPPIPAGHIRLYRGEKEVLEEPKYPYPPEHEAGRFFSELKHEGEFYAAGPGRGLRYIDLPAEQAEKYRVRPGEPTFKLPGELAEPVPKIAGETRGKELLAQLKARPVETLVTTKKGRPSLEKRFPVGTEAEAISETIPVRGTIIGWEKSPEGRYLAKFKVRELDAGEGWKSLAEGGEPITLDPRGAQIKPLAARAPTAEQPRAGVRPSPYTPESNLFNTPALRGNTTYAWRSMGDGEFNKLIQGEKEYIGEKAATKGHYLAGIPESAAQYGGKGKVLVEFGGVKIEGGEGLAVGSRATRDNITRVWRYNTARQEWAEAPELLPERTVQQPKIGLEEALKAGPRKVEDFMKAEGISVLEGPFNPATGQQSLSIVDKAGKVIGRAESREDVSRILQEKYQVKLHAGLDIVEDLFNIARRKAPHEVLAVEEAVDNIGTTQRVWSLKAERLAEEINKLLPRGKEKIVMTNFAGKPQYEMTRRELVAHAVEQPELIQFLDLGEQRAAALIRQTFDEAGSEAQRRGFLESWIDNYITHKYKDPEKARTYYTMKREIPTIEKAIELGLKPVTDPALLAQLYTGTLGRRIAYAEGIDSLKGARNARGLPVIMKEAEAPADYVWVPGQSPRAIGFEKPREVWKVDPLVAPELGKFLDWLSNNPYRWDEKYLGPLFAGTKLLITYNPADNFAWAWSKVFSQYLVNPLAVGKMIAKGKNPLRLEGDVLADFVAAGGNSAKLRSFQSELTEHIRVQLEQLDKGFTAWIRRAAKHPAREVIIKGSDITFGKIVGTAQLYSFQLLREKFIQKGFTAEEAAKMAARHANIIHETMPKEWSRPNGLLGLRFGRFLLFARERMRTIISTSLGAIGRGKGMRGLDPSGQAALASELRNYLLGMALGLYLHVNLVNKYLVGHWAFENEPGHRLDIQYGKPSEYPDRRARYVVTSAGKQFRDMMHWIGGVGTGQASWAEPLKTLANRIHPIVKEAAELVGEAASRTGAFHPGAKPVETAKEVGQKTLESFLPSGAPVALEPPYKVSWGERLAPMLTGVNIRRGAPGGVKGEVQRSFKKRESFEQGQRDQRMREFLDQGDISSARREYWDARKYPNLPRSVEAWNRIYQNYHKAGTSREFGPSEQGRFRRWMARERANQ